MVKANRNVRPDQFLTEAIITGALEHPNIVPIYDMGMSNDGVRFYAMKEVRGATWSETIDTQSETEILNVLLSVSDALAFAHSRGVTHRDLKPSNVMLGEFGEVMVMDWGFALPSGDMAQRGLAPLGAVVSGQVEARACGIRCLHKPGSPCARCRCLHQNIFLKKYSK